MAKYSHHLARMAERNGGAALGGNAKMVAVGRTTPSWLKVTSGAEAMSLLLTSERVFADMIDWIKYGEPEQICLRKFDECMSQEYEFRAFVYGGKLTALSQYDHYTVYPLTSDTELKERIEKRIRESWLKLRDSVGEEDYVADFIYDPKSDRAVLIELGPFLDVTGPACFSWSTDRALLTNGPFEFRLRSEPHPQAEDLIEANWLYRWETPVKPYYELLYEHYKQIRRLHRVDDDGASAQEGPFAKRRIHVGVGVGVGAWLSGMILSPRSRPLRRLVRRVVTQLWPVVMCVVQLVRPILRILQPLLPVLLRAVQPIGWLVSFLIETVVPGETDLVRGTGVLVEDVRKCVGDLVEEQPVRLFVYGTLKRGFQWNTKYMTHNASYLGRAVTCEPMQLLVGDSGVPYVLGDSYTTSSDGAGSGAEPLQRIRGELWSCSESALSSMDEYEGISKGYYQRKRISVWLTNENGRGSGGASGRGERGEVVQAFVYCVCESSDALKAIVDGGGGGLAEYELEAHHRAMYKPIKHIRVKQQLHLRVQLGGAAET